MAEKKRYLIGHRYGPRLDTKTEQELDSFVAQQEGVAEVRRTQVGRRVMHMSEEQMRAFAEQSPDLVIEEDEPLDLFGMPGLPARLESFEGFSMPVTVKDGTTNKAVSDVTIYGIGSGVTYKAVTNSKGQATLQTHEARLQRVIASPRDSFWSHVVESVEVNKDRTLAITLKPLLVTGAYDWGHRLMGFRQVNRIWTGRDVNVAVIDSGLHAEHEDLEAAGGSNTLDGQDTDLWTVDEEGHGTHVSGVVAARNNDIGIVGGAPNANVFSLKVFPGGFVSDLVEAVEWCIQNRMDVINMSLGGRNPSQVLAGVLNDAYDRGITCIAAAGNDRTRVAYPAAYPSVIAVSAVGAFGSFPEDSGHNLKVSDRVDRFGRLFAADFTNFGPEIDLCAPGVAILSTVPTGYASWDGTSMASPMVSALAALIVEGYPQIRSGDRQQVDYLRAILNWAAVDTGLDSNLQGAGLPTATRALAYATPPVDPSVFAPGMAA